MSDTYNTPKLDKTGLTQLWSIIVADFAQKNDFTALKTIVDAMEAGAQVNVIENVKVNGVSLDINDKSVNILVPTGALASKDKVSLADADTDLAAQIALIASKADSVNVYTKDEIDAKIAGVYKVKGSIAFADLPSSAESGDLYNVTDSFVTTDAFVEGSGKEYPAGTNVAYTIDGKWDCMSGVYDFSEFVKKTDITSISTEEIAQICTLPE